MKNFEKWKKEILEITKTKNIVALRNGKPTICDTKNIGCNECGFNGDKPCFVTRMNWFYEEYLEKPKLTKRERQFVEVMGEDMHIARDKSGTLYLCTTKPYKEQFTWGNTVFIKMERFNNLEFDFIKWEDKEPWSTEELLKLEIEDEQ